MHRPTEVARWYRRVDPRCFTDEDRPAALDRSYRARWIRNIARAPVGWLTVAYAYIARAIVGGA
ncbi:MAG: hypothetical protein M3O34_02325 [Chloroflexota bacterium]|nr:hypothetical protein [Chloroflexota bacterium]